MVNTFFNNPKYTPILFIVPSVLDVLINVIRPTP